MTPTQLFEAAAEGNLDFIRKHKEHYRDKNERGWTVLHFAARYGQLEVATFLSSQAGCDILAVNNEGKTAADVAEFWGHDKVSKVLKPPTPSVSNTQILEKDTSDSNNTLVSNFSQNITNFFAGSFLNRLSRYRNDYSILQRLAHSPQSKFILFSKLNPLFDKSNDNSVYLASYSEVASLVDMIYGENKNIEKAVSKDEPILVFLGVDERNAKGEEGVAYWALDVTPRGKCQESLEDLTKEFESRGLDFAPTLPKAFKIDMRLASVLAQARAMVDWNKRNAFCPGCGRVTASAEGGHKRVCPVPKEDESCISHNGGVHNFTYPRTDPVIIVCIVHPTEDKILLGRQKSWPGKMFSCIAGFVEAGESIEEAVRREAIEETGIVVDRVSYHSSQPWPFPNSLMFGFIAEAVTTDIKLEDKELESAVWFTRSEVLASLKGNKDSPFAMPAANAIAYKLVKTWAFEWSRVISAKI